MLNPWLNLMLLAAESQQVICLRTLQFASGKMNGTESRLMVFEKITAASSASRSLMVGATLSSVVDDYRVAVQANLRRLSGVENQSMLKSPAETRGLAENSATTPFSGC